LDYPVLRIPAAMASASLAKDKRVNIRISSRDLDDIQANTEK